MPRGGRRGELIEAGAGGGGAPRRRPAGRRDFHLERHRGQCAGADAGDRDQRLKSARATGCSCRRSSILRCAPAGDFRARRSKIFRSTPTGGSISRRWRRRCRARRGRWSRSCSPTTRPASSSRSREAAAIVHAANGLLHVDAVQAAGRIAFDIERARRRFADALGAQDRRPEGRRRPGAAERRYPFRRAADSRRRPGARHARRHRECRRHCGLRRGCGGGAGGSLPTKPLTCWRCGPGWKPGSRRSRRRR